MEVQDCCEGQISKTWFVNLMWIKISYLTLLFNGCNWCHVSNGSPLGKWISELKYIFFFLYKNVTSGIVLSVWTSHICDMGLECLSVINVQHIILHFLPASEDFFSFDWSLCATATQLTFFPRKGKGNDCYGSLREYWNIFMTNYEFATGNIIKKKSVNILIKERERLKRHSQTYHVVLQSDISYKSF